MDPNPCSIPPTVKEDEQTIWFTMCSLNHWGVCPMWWQEVHGLFFAPSCGLFRRFIHIRDQGVAHHDCPAPSTRGYPLGCCSTRFIHISHCLLITTLSQRLGFKSTYPPILARAAQKVLELLFQNTLFALKFVLNSCYYTHFLMENKLKNFQIWLKNSYSLFSPGARDHSTKSLNSFLLTRYTYKDRAVFVVVHTSSLFLGKSPEMPW